jgi:hypothetical protein
LALVAVDRLWLRGWSGRPWFLALWTLLGAALLARFLRFGRRGWKPLLLSWLLVSALYSSLWTLVPLPFVAGRELWWLGRRLWRSRPGLGYDPGFA